jgi:PhnB protein
VRPYLYGKLDLLDFVQRTFEAEILERHEFSATSFHVEARIGDSVVVMEASDPPEATAAASSVYVYVEDVDETYRRALEAGGFAVSEPEDKPYDERSAGVMDSFGNTWWISTFTGS